MADRRLVIVDDSESMRRLVREIAVERGFEVVGEAADGRAGVQRVLALAPDVVVMDWRMPEMDGVDATAELCRRQPGLHLIAFSSATDEVIRQEFLKAGAAAYVPKHDLEGLLAALAAAVA